MIMVLCWGSEVVGWSGEGWERRLGSGLAAWALYVHVLYGIDGIGLLLWAEMSLIELGRDEPSRGLSEGLRAY